MVIDNERTKKQHIELTETDRSYLAEVIREKQVASRVLKRALALLALDQGETLEAVAGHQQVTNETIANLKKRYQRQGIGCLQDAPRSGRPVEIDGELRAKITALACSEVPKGYSQWSLRLLADRIVALEYCDTISYSQVRKVLKKTLSSHTENAPGASAQ